MQNLRYDAGAESKWLDVGRSLIRRYSHSFIYCDFPHWLIRREQRLYYLVQVDGRLFNIFRRLEKIAWQIYWLHCIGQDEFHAVTEIYSEIVRKRVLLDEVGKNA